MESKIKIDYDSLIQRYTSGELTANELRHLQDSINNSAEERYIFSSTLEIRSMLRDDLLSIELPEDFSEDIRVQVAELFAKEKDKPILLPVLPLTDSENVTEDEPSIINEKSVKPYKQMQSGFSLNQFISENKKANNQNINSKIKFTLVAVVILLLFSPIGSENFNTNKLAFNSGEKNINPEAKTVIPKLSTNYINKNGLVNGNVADNKLSYQNDEINSVELKNIFSKQIITNDFTGKNFTKAGFQNSSLANQTSKHSSKYRNVNHDNQDNNDNYDNNELNDIDKNIYDDNLIASEISNSLQASDNQFPGVNENKISNTENSNNNTSENNVNSRIINTKEQILASLAKFKNANVGIESIDSQNDKKYFSIGINLSPSNMSNINSYYISLNLSENDRIGIEVGGIVADMPINSKVFTSNNLNKRVSTKQPTEVSSINPHQSFGKVATHSIDAAQNTEPICLPTESVQENGGLGKRATGDYYEYDVLYNSFAEATVAESELALRPPVFTNSASKSLLQTYGAIFYDRKFKIYEFMDACSRVAVGGTDNAVLGNAKLYVAANISKNISVTLGAYGIYSHVFSKMMVTPPSTQGLFLGVETGL